MPPDAPSPREPRRVRDATTSDAEACARIYGSYVTGSTATFELEPPDAPTMAARIEAALTTHAWVVLEDAERVVGYAYGGPFKARPAYRWTCEVSVYLDPDHRGRGGGRLLYTALLERLAGRGYRTAAAGMTQPNEASARLHAALGFERVGTFRAVGWKHGAWRDVAWVQRSIGEPHVGPEPPPEPR